MIINSELYQIFYYVAQNKSLTAAANQLYLSQSTVSRAIQSLENKLNCTLFIRSPKGMELTEQGIYLFGHVKKAATELTMAESHLQKVNSLRGGFLRIGVTELTLQYDLMSHLNALQSQYPGLNVSLSFESRLVNESLKKGLLDLAVMTTPIIEDDSIFVKRLRPMQDVLIGGSRYRKYAGRKVSITELAGEDFILMKKDTSTREYVEQLDARHGIRLNPKYEVATLTLIRMMAEQNMGLGILPEEYIKDYSGTDLFVIDLKEGLPPREVCILYSKEYYNHPIRDMFLKKLTS